MSTEPMATAVDWLVRQRDPAFAAWEAFADWLAADPAHAAAYHEAAAADADLDGLLAPQPTPTARGPVRAPRPHRRWIGAGIAAALVAGIAGRALLPNAAQPYAVETAPGERRTVVLAPGTQVAMNGGTRLVLDRRDPRRATLDHGQALFDVRHDPAHPFAVTVAGATLVDVGTRFEVTRDPGTLAVAVAQGAVDYRPGGEPVRLGAGDTLAARDAEERVLLGRIAPGDVGAWREGRLSFDGAPLALVAAALGRNLGMPVAADSAIAGRPFRGAISLAGGREAVAARLAPVLGVAVRRTGRGWVLAAR